jgi:uncharacterized protein YvpB
MKRFRNRSIFAIGLVVLMFSLLNVTHAETSSAAKEIANVPVLGQNPELPTGCEATSLTMLLNWANVHVKKTDVAAAFPKVPVPVLADGGWFGGDPNRGFVGNPFTVDGYGVYHGPVAALLTHFLPGRAEDLSGSSFDKVIAALASGRPVIAWISDDMQEPKLYLTWSTPQGSKINWMVPEHVVVITGYTASTIEVHDPERNATLKYPRTLFQQRWEQMGKQAVTVTQVVDAQKQASGAPNKAAATDSASAEASLNWVGKTRAYFSRSQNTETVFMVKIVALTMGIVYCVMISVLTVIKRKR